MLRVLVSTSDAGALRDWGLLISIEFSHDARKRTQSQRQIDEVRTRIDYRERLIRKTTENQRKNETADGRINIAHRKECSHGHIYAYVCMDVIYIYIYIYIRVSLNNESWRSPRATLATGSIRGKNKLCKRFLDLVNV